MFDFIVLFFMKWDNKVLKPSCFWVWSSMHSVMDNFSPFNLSLFQVKMGTLETYLNGLIVFFFMFFYVSLLSLFTTTTVLDSELESGKTSTVRSRPMSGRTMGVSKPMGGAYLPRTPPLLRTPISSQRRLRRRWWACPYLSTADRYSRRKLGPRFANKIMI